MASARRALSALDFLHAGLLPLVKLELVMKEGVEFVLNRFWRRDEGSADHRPEDRGAEGDKRDKQQAAPIGHSLEPSRVEGASAGGAPKGASEEPGVS